MSALRQRADMFGDKINVCFVLFEDIRDTIFAKVVPRNFLRLHRSPTSNRVEKAYPRNMALAHGLRCW